MIKPVSKYVVLWTLLLIISVPAALADTKFPKPTSLSPAVELWKKVYTQVNTNQGYIHDKVNMGVIYEKMSLKSKGRKAQGREIKRRLANYRAALRSLGKGKRSKLSSTEQKVLNAWGKNTKDAVFAKAAKNVRFQRGQANKFRQGLVRSGAYIKHIKKVFKGMGLPERLAYLPHVESSFNAAAYSHVGAAGMWQFMRSTGRRFMRIDHVVDERLDVEKATRAAAELLQHNHSVLKSWPLALTAYNHGLAGMRRAKRKTGTDDIGVIVKRYKGRTFGFASRNFYAAYLAASEIAAKPNKYFGKLNLSKPKVHPKVKLRRYLPVKDLSAGLSVGVSQLKKLNPALRPAVWKGEKYLPRGYLLKLPSSSNQSTWRGLVASVEKQSGKAKQKPDHYYRVQRGDSLSTIARRYKTKVSTLMALNNLRSKHRIRIGQKLRLPGAGKLKPAKPSAQPKPKKKVVLQSSQYEIRSGDTLSGIAQKHGMSTRQLLALNHLRKSSMIKPGQILLVEQPQKQVAVATKPEVEPETPAESVRHLLHKPEYLVQPGDTISDIAARYKMPEAELLAINNLSIRSIIRPGQIIKLRAVEEQKVAIKADAEKVQKQVTEQKVDKLAALEPAVADQPATQGIELESGATGEGVPVEAQSDLSADPSDYQVSDNLSIEVQVGETLGHYADWLEVKTSSLRRLNRRSYGKRIEVGKKLQMNFSNVDKTKFVHRRENYHIARQNEYFDNHVIAGACTHKVGRGDSLWDIANKTYNVPFWLLRQYNPDITLKSVLSRGQELQIPLVKAKNTQGLPEMRSANGSMCSTS